MTRAAIALILLLTGCAHPAPVLDQPTPILTISEALQADAEICVMANPWNDPTPVCITIGDLRRLLRHRVDVVAHGRTSGVTR
jgi:hypothetical protein